MSFTSFIARFQRIQWLQPSVIALMLANFIPVIGVFAFHWEVFPLLFLFWLENVIIGVVNIFKMLLAGVGAKDLPRYGSVIFWVLKLFLIPFFCAHYGMFTFAHGMFVVGFFDKGALHDFGGFNFQLVFHIIHEYHLDWPFAALVVSHLISFSWDYLWSGAFRHANPVDLMTQPYRRVVVMHLTVLIGGFLTLALHLPEAALIFLVVLKTGTDLWGHQGERERRLALLSPAAATPSAASPPSLQNILQAALQQRARQTGQTSPISRDDKKQLAIVLAVVVVVLGLFLWGIGSFVYDFVTPFGGHSRTTAAKSAVSTAVWRLDLGNVQPIVAPAAGKFRGDNFHVEHAIFANGTLNLRQGSGTNSRTFIITLPLRKGETLSGHSYKILPNDTSTPPEIKLAWHENSKKTQSQVFTSGYAMKLDFFWPTGNKTPAMIYLCLPDSDKSYVAGKFDVIIRKSKSTSVPDDN